MTFYRSFGMRNEVETQKELTQVTSIQQTSMQYLSRGWSENNRFQNTFYRSLGLRNQVETQ